MVVNTYKKRNNFMIFFFILISSAILLSIVSAYFNVSGLIAIFPSAVLAAICMGVTLEIGKLVSAAFAYRYYKISKNITRFFIFVICVLTIITSIDIFGFLSKSHVSDIQNVKNNSDDVAYVQQVIDNTKLSIRDDSVQISQMDRAVDLYLKDSTKATTAVKLKASQHPNRVAIVADVDRRNLALLVLQKQKDSLSAIQRKAEVNTSPLRYFGELFGVSDLNKVFRWFVLILVSIFDPLAILLSVAASIHLKELKSSKMTKPTKEPDTEVKIDAERPLSRLYEPKLTSKLDGINERMMETMDDTHDFGFTDPPSRPIIQVIHP